MLGLSLKIQQFGMTWDARKSHLLPVRVADVWVSEECVDQVEDLSAVHQGHLLTLVAERQQESTGHKDTYVCVDHFWRNWGIAVNKEK